MLTKSLCAYSYDKKQPFYKKKKCIPIYTEQQSTFVVLDQSNTCTRTFLCEIYCSIQSEIKDRLRSVMLQLMDII